jgi:hypothetical protein
MGGQGDADGIHLGIGGQRHGIGEWLSAHFLGQDSSLLGRP